MGTSLGSLSSSHATGSCQSVRVDSLAQSGPQSTPGPQEDKAGDSGGDSGGDSAKASNQVAEEKQPAQTPVPLCECPRETQM